MTYNFRVRRNDETSLKGPVLGYYCGKGPSGPEVCTNETVGASFYTGRYREMRDIPTPGYYRRLANGDDVSNPCDFYISDVEARDGSWSYYVSRSNGETGRGAYNGCGASFLPTALISLPDYVLADESAMRQYLLTSAFAEANSSDFSGQTFAAEALKTARMLTSPLNSIKSLLESMLRKRKKLIQKGLSLADASASAWLEFRYGWRPLFMDCADLFKGLAQSDRVPDVVLRARSRDTVTWFGSKTEEVFNNGFFRFTGTHELSYKSVCRAGIRYKIVDPSYGQFLDSTLGLGLEHVPETVWELVPFSFVADWFVNVGDWLKAVIPNPHVHILSNYTSATRTSVSVMKYPRAEFNGTSWSVGQWVRAGDAGSISTTVKSGDRAVNVAWRAVPMLVPGRLSLIRKIDGLSLLLQTMRGKLGSFKYSS